MRAEQTPPWKWRRRATAALQAYFEKRSYPRTMLTLVLMFAGAAGFLVSSGLLRLGVDHMWMRYPIAVGTGYAVLLALVRAWVELERRNFDPDDPALRDVEPEFKLHHQPTRRWWDWLDIGNLDVLDGDEGCVPLLIVGIILMLVGIALTTIFAAPALIAEVFLDAFLVTVLYRRLRVAQKEHWLGTAIRKTWTLALTTAAFLALGGLVLEQIAPGARSIGQAIKQLTQP